MHLANIITSIIEVANTGIQPMPNVFNAFVTRLKRKGANRLRCSKQGTVTTHNPITTHTTYVHFAHPHQTVSPLTLPAKKPPNRDKLVPIDVKEHTHTHRQFHNPI